MNFRVPYNYLPEQFGSRDDIFVKWKELALSGEFTLGSSVELFEVNFASYMGTKYCVSTNTGTDALILSLKAVGIKEGDEVITAPNSFFATAGAIVACGARPVFVDVDSRMQIDHDKIEKKINEKTKAIVPVYWAGGGPNMLRIEEIAKRNKLKIVADACMAIGGKYSGRTAANWGDVVAYSMHPLKSLNVMGDGGAITTNNYDYANWLTKYRNHGMINRDEIDFYGVNSRMQPLQAIVATIELEKLDKVIERRNRIARIYDRKLSALYPEVQTVPRRDDDLETYSLYMIIVNRRDELLDTLIASGIEAKIHYPIPLHKQKASITLNLNDEDLLNAEEQALKIITLPCHQFLSDSQVEYVIQTITNFFE
jgi:dTDP-4-amino-4,6-dideoxygalactose transaminase